MAEHNYHRSIGFEAGEDLSAKQNHFVNVNTDREVVSPTANGRAIGVNLDNGKEGETVGVMTESGSLIEIVAAAAIAVGADIATNAAGRAVTAAGVTTQVLGVAMEAADSDGDLITMLFQPRGFFAQV